MQYKSFIRQPSIDMYAGIIVSKDTDEIFENEHVKQTIKDLVMISEMRDKGEGYESVYNVKVFLEEGDVLIYDENRGYIKPVERFVTVPEAIEELRCVHECHKEGDNV